MPVLEHRVSATLDVDQPWVEVVVEIDVEIEHHLDHPDFARVNFRKGAFPRSKVDVPGLTHVFEREVWQLNENPVREYHGRPLPADVRARITLVALVAGTVRTRWPSLEFLSRRVTHGHARSGAWSRATPMPLHRYKRPHTEHPFVGKWRITGMELWDDDYVNMERRAFIEIDPGNQGSFEFALVRGELDGYLDYVEGETREGPRDSTPPERVRQRSRGLHPREQP